MLNKTHLREPLEDTVSYLLLLYLETFGLNLRTVISGFLIVCDQTFGPDFRTVVTYSVNWILYPWMFFPPSTSVRQARSRHSSSFNAAFTLRFNLCVLVS